MRTILLLLALCAPGHAQCVYYDCTSGKLLEFVTYPIQQSDCWWCPKCNKYHCGPRPDMGQQPHQQQPQMPDWGDEGTPKFESRPDANPQTPTEPVRPPEPTPDPQAIENAKAEAVAAAKAELKNEISVLVKNEIAAAPACDCGPRLAALELAIQAQKEVNAECLAVLKELSKPFKLRVRNPKTGTETPYIDVYPGKKVTIDLSPVTP